MAHGFPVEAIVFMGIIFMLLLLLVLFFLYLNKAMCFANCGGFPCLENEKPINKKEKSSLDQSYGYEDESSSDSEDELIMRYQASLHPQLPRQPSIMRKPPKSIGNGDVMYGSTDQMEPLEEEEFEVDEDGYIVHDVEYVEGDEDDETSAPSDSEASLPPFPNMKEVPPSDIQLEIPQFESLADSNSNLFRDEDEEEPLIKNEIVFGMDKIKTENKESSDVNEGERAAGINDIKAVKSDDASAGDSDLAGGSQEERGIEGEVLDDSQLPTDRGESLAISGDGTLAGPDESRGPSVGEVEVAFQYSGENRRMNITIIQCHNLPSKDKGGAGSYRLRLVLYPAKRQRAKTRIRDGDKPEFKELFRFSRIYPHELVSSSIRIRLYGAERMRKERLIGEGIVKFSALNVSKKQVIRLRLKPQSELGGGDDTPYSSTSDLSQSESSSSLQSLSHGGGLPELLTGLSYNSTTGRLAVEIIKGSHFKQLAAGRAPDSYVKVAVMSSSGFEMSKSKSSVRRGQPNPTFKETFIFQIAQFQLNEVTLMFTVFNKKGMKRKNAIGWFSMGLSNTSEEELAHWNEMQSSNGQQVCRWHALLESKS